MTFYYQQILQIRDKHMLNDHIINKVITGKKFIDENFYEDINLDMVAGCSFFSRYHFIRLFRQAYGMTPHQYIREKRMILAMQLLKDGLPVTETCFRTGFYSQPSFSTLFKKYCGQTPEEYKNSNIRYEQ